MQQLQMSCLLGEKNIVVDDQDLATTELTFIIDLLCTLQFAILLLYCANYIVLTIMLVLLLRCEIITVF